MTDTPTTTMTKTTPLSKISRRRLLQATLAGVGATAAGIRFINHAEAAEEKKLNFYNWDTYIGETTLPDFKNATGIDITLSLFADNDELFAKLKDGNPGFDLIVPSGFTVSRMIQSKMLMPLNYHKIPNFAKNISNEFKDAGFDPGRKFSITYMWGTTGIGYRKSKVKGVPTWKDMYDSDKYKGRIGLMNNVTTLHMIAKYLGFGMNPADKAKVDAATALLIKQKPNIKIFHEDNGQDLLASGEIDLVHEYNGDIVQVMSEDKDLAYVIPDSGTEIWQDNLAIPTNAPHPDNAHDFINYILDAEVGAKIIETVQYASPNAAARAKMGKDYSSNPSIFPPLAIIKKCEPILYGGEEMEDYYASSWTKVQAA